MSETAQDKVNRILRDHEGYTGDGKGGVGALPIGDRSTRAKPIVKRDLREVLIAALQEILSTSDDLNAVAVTLPAGTDATASWDGQTKTLTLGLPRGLDGDGAGDMTKIVYDQNNVNGDAFSMGNMIETGTSKVFTDAERSKLAGVPDIATLAEFVSATANRAYGTASIWQDLVALTDAATITVNLNNGYDFGGSGNAKLNLGGNRTLGSPSNGRTGQKGVLWFGASGSTRTLTLHSDWKLVEGVEAGPYSITTSDTLGVAYVCLGSTVYVTAILRG